jgi:hypothetical protein
MLMNLYYHLIMYLFGPIQGVVELCSDLTAADTLVISVNYLFRPHSLRRFVHHHGPMQV